MIDFQKRQTEIPTSSPSTRPSSTAVFRGSASGSESAASTGEQPEPAALGIPPSKPTGETTGDAKESKQVRILTIKADLGYSDPDKATRRRLRDVGWQSARYKNGNIRRLWAQSVGLSDPAAAAEGVKNSATKIGRQTEKEELSGAAYAAAEREVQGAWSRDRKLIMAGQPLPEWSPNASLSIRGHKVKKSSGVRLEIEGSQYVCYLAIQNERCVSGLKRPEPDSPAGGCWIRIPIARHSNQDEYQGDLLNAMVSWQIPIAKATVRMGHKILIRLTYERTILLPPMGARVAVLGPLEKDGRLHLRTETQTLDFTSKIQNILRRKDDWDLIRRRVTCQIGRRKGHARTKRTLLSRKTWAQWIDTYLHTWAREIVNWCASQGVGSLRLIQIDNGDWPAFQLTQFLKDKGLETGVAITQETDLEPDAAARAVKSVISKESKKVVKRQRAVREIVSQIDKEA